jgi:hypothetical protein
MERLDKMVDYLGEMTRLLRHISAAGDALRDEVREDSEIPQPLQPVAREESLAPLSSPSPSPRLFPSQPLAEVNVQTSDVEMVLSPTLPHSRPNVNLIQATPDTSQSEKNQPPVTQLIPTPQKPVVPPPHETTTETPLRMSLILPPNPFIPDY